MIEHASVEIEQLAEEIRAANERRDRTRTLIARTDRVVNRLEVLNHGGTKRLLPGDLSKIRRFLADVPAACMEAFRDSENVQEVLDSMFEVQERLLRVVRGRLYDDDSDQED